MVAVAVVWVSHGRRRLWSCAHGPRDLRFGTEVLESTPPKGFQKLPPLDHAASQVVPGSSLFLLVAGLEEALVLCKR